MKPSLKSSLKAPPKMPRRWRNTQPNNLLSYEKGLHYEEFVCRWLKQQGYHILDRNYRGRKQSELDLVAKDGKTLVFIEVKARRGKSRFSPLRSIDLRKRRALATACSDYLTQLQFLGIDTQELDLRFDIITLAFNESGTPVSLTHYPDYLEIHRAYF